MYHPISPLPSSLIHSHYKKIKMVNLLSRLLLFLLSLHCFVACLAANTKNITTDQSALLAFKSLITSDPYDMLANNWSTSSSVCSWVGVTCDERHERVHSLILQNMSFKGTVSPNLGNLSFLVILDLKNNSFGGQFPTEVCLLRRLKVLHISYNKFEGGIPAALGDLSQLQYLYLGANNFSGFIPQSIGNLYQLKKLDTAQNRFAGPIPQSILNLSSLEYIDLSSNYFSGNPNTDIMCHICYIFLVVTLFLMLE
ncbi:putative non-specific serine/threonine protein kinase [Medicago truncatula]|uniref:Putative non-specific serine/threonine protein kinase n=2 Tax=Medicago truncatula TaxID=3880 RepID=A0A396GKX5_MEDTR|nr:putative non-specific serine/threonine protein kinase [Medicago truncatula]